MAEVPEVPQNPLEAQLITDALGVREKMGRIEELTEIAYVPGFENKVGYFFMLENLEGKPILARFSYGKDAPNMSAVFFNPITETAQMGEDNTKKFLESQGFTGSTIQVLGKFQGNEAQIEEVDQYTLKEKVKVVGNVIYTRDPNIILIIKPADCPTGVLYCKDDKGNDVSAIIHGGAEAVNDGLIRQGLQALQIELGVDLSKSKLCIFPGVSQDNYYISRQWRLPNGEIKKRESGIYPINWGEFISQQQTDDPEEKRYLDITSAYEMQALQAGIIPENIQAIRRNTYEDARNGLAFSRRFSGENQDADGNRARDGGQMVAVQLKNKVVEMPVSSQLDDLVKAA